MNALSLTPRSATSPLLSYNRTPTSTSSPLLYQALSVTKSLRDDRERDTKEQEDEISGLRAINRQLEQSLRDTSPNSNNTSRLLDEVLAKAHEVRRLQESELSSASATPGRGSAAVDSLLTSLAKERDEAKSDCSSSEQEKHQLRLQLANIKHQLSSSVSELERLKNQMQNKDTELEKQGRELRSKERDDVIQRAEVATQRDETNKLREETHVLKRTTRDLIDELERSKSKVTELLLTRDAYEDKQKDTLVRLDLHQKESASLRDSLALVTKDCELQHATVNQRTKELEHLTQEIETAREVLMKEQQERNETENVLKELIEEAQELRHSREHDRSAIASVKKENSQQLTQFKNKVIEMENALIEAKHAMQSETTARSNAEKAYDTLNTLRTADEASRKAQHEGMENIEEETERLRSQVLENEAVTLQINELKNDKIDLKELLKDSQDYLIKSKEEGQAHLQAEEHRWNNRLDSAKNEIIQLEEDLRKLKNGFSTETKRKETIESTSRTQRAELENVKDENIRLATGVQAKEAVIVKLTQKNLSLQKAGKMALVTAKEEAYKNVKTNKVLKECRLNYEKSIQLQGKLEIDLQLTNAKNEELTRVNIELETKTSRNHSTVRELEREMEFSNKNHRTTNLGLIAELDEMRRSFDSFLRLSKEQVRDMKRSSSSPMGRVEKGRW